MKEAEGMFAHRKELAFQQACTKEQAELLEYQRYLTSLLLSWLVVAVAVVTVAVLVMLSLLLLSLLLAILLLSLLLLLSPLLVLVTLVLIVVLTPYSFQRLLLSWMVFLVRPCAGYGWCFFGPP